MHRTHNCGELVLEDAGKKAKLSGWVSKRRDHGGVIFIDLRDRYGITQIVFDPSHNKETHSKAERLGREWVLTVEGKIRKRPEGMTNKELKTGGIELVADSLKVVTKSKVPPIEIEDEVEAHEDTRMRYRYLDLRRPKIQNYFLKRHEAARTIREYLNKKDFMEIETPILIKSTPEGARDYVVPSRVNPGQFYALPQSPQLYKQVLMIAGFDRYYQIARCLRDEDLRQDRQPEHTQVDMEMSFVEQEDIMDLVEGCAVHLVKTLTGKEVGNFERISYKDSMERFGTDKPDLRFGMELTDVTELVKESDFKVFSEAEKVKCVTAEKDFTRKEIDGLIEWSKEQGAKGLAWMKVSEDGLESSIAKFFSKSLQKKMLEKTGAKKGNVLFFVADKPKIVASVLGSLRNELANRLELLDPLDFRFCWITDFPLFEWNEDDEKWDPSHHPFTMPYPEDIEKIDSSPGEVKGQLYDLVLNGVELGSGSIRINYPELQKKVFTRIGISEEEAMKKFGFLLEAYNYGAPVHGGIGWGFDRTVALLLGFNDIREVIAFPKNKAAQSPMDGSPSAIDQKQMKELYLKTDVEKK